MYLSIREKVQSAASTWGRDLVILAITVFLARLGQGLLGGVSTNFFVDVLGLSGKQVLWLAGIREIPGLSLVLIAALISHWPLSRRAGTALLLMGVGYGLYALVHSYTALLAVAIVGSLGFHNWTPVQSALGLALAKKEHSGRILGTLSSMGSLASLVGMGVTAALAATLPLRSFYVLGGVAMAVGGLLVSRIPASVGESRVVQPRILFKKRYWLYYVLTFFEGSRMQVFGTFGTLVLVQDYGLKAQQVSLLLVVSGVVNFVLAPRMGRLLDIVGERTTLALSYVALALCFIGYATVHNVLFLALMLIGINLLVTLRIGLSTYVNRIAPSEELAPTLSAGVSVNHITSVSMSLVAGTLLSIVGYEWLCWGAAAVIMLSVPFALGIRVQAPVPVQSTAETG
ncbi:MAG: MFS transporter [Anaerolineae bacterium]|jgi:predicted MFS family arabinose efflux permease